jgi:glycosyltransferase involved in cell wall biosynthesis
MDTTARLRILVLAPQPFFEVRGTPLAVRALVGVLGEMGHAVDLLTFPRGETVPLAPVRQLRSARLPVGRVRPGFSLAKALLDVPFLIEGGARMLLGRYDVVHAVEEAAHLIAPMARLFRRPYVMDVDSSIPEQLAASRLPFRRPLAAVARALETHALRRSTAVVTVCGSLTESVHRVAPGAAVFQIEDPPLVSAEARATPEEIGALRATLGIGERQVALYSGNLEHYQGVNLLVDAAAHLDGVTIVVMGGEHAEIEALKGRARDLGAAHRVVFAGKRPPSELPAFLGLADVLVSPRREGRNTPFKLYTYLASGKPLVATAIPTHTQLLHAGIATLVEPTAEGLVAGIRQVLGDPLAAVERAVRARSLIEREFGPQAFAGKVRRAYEHVAAAVKRRRR